jgi:hypothetical protein
MVIGVILVVAVLVLGLGFLGAFLLPRVSVPPSVCGALECGPAFVMGNPIESRCAGNDTFPVNGCLGGDYSYMLTVEQSSFPFGDISFRVVNSSGSVIIATGALGFSVTNLTSTVVAQSAVDAGVMAMISGWTYASGTSSSTPLTNIYGVVVDMGSVDPTGRGYGFVAVVMSPAMGENTLPLP